MSAQPFLIAAAGLFSMGIYGILVRRNAVMVLLSIELSLIHISEPTRPRLISYAVVCLK